VTLDASQRSARSGSGRSRSLDRLGLAAGATGSAFILALIAFMVAGAETPPGWYWLQRTLSIGGERATALVLGVPLALCLLGLVCGSVGWVSARRKGTSTRTPRLSVLLALIAPLVVAAGVAVYVVMLLVIFSSPLRPPG
jgi:hypothetical protein